MKTINFKVKAFTLTEVMVVMVISAIVAGLAFSVLNVVQNNMRSIDANYEYQEQIQSLETALTIDFNKFTSIKWNPIDDTMLVFSPLQERKYIFFKDSIVSDLYTYSLLIKEKEFYFKGEPVNSGSIDAVKLTFYNTRDLHRVFVFKYNDPTIHF